MLDTKTIEKLDNFFCRILNDTHDDIYMEHVKAAEKVFGKKIVEEYFTEEIVHLDMSRSGDNTLTINGLAEPYLGNVVVNGIATLLKFIPGGMRNTVLLKAINKVPEEDKLNQMRGSAGHEVNDYEDFTWDIRPIKTDEEETEKEFDLDMDKMDISELIDLYNALKNLNDHLKDEDDLD